MAHNIIVDSCLDYGPAINEADFIRIPFHIQVGEKAFLDTTQDTSPILAEMQDKKARVKTACPSPEDFFSVVCKEASNVIVTISAKLSGSFQSAFAAKNQAAEEGVAEIEVIDSKSAAAGQNLVALKVKELLASVDFSQAVEKAREYAAGLETFFFPKNIDNLERAGRITGVRALVGRFLNIVPLLASNGDGELELLEKVRGDKQATNALIDIIAQRAAGLKDAVAAITHVNALEKALDFKRRMEELNIFKNVHIFQAGGLSTVYAAEGGLVIAF